METLLALTVIFLLFEIPACIGMGLIFKKMKLGFKKGIIPFYNKIVLINKYKLKQYNIILVFIPILGFITNYQIYKCLGKEYNKDMIYILELTFFPFIFNIFFGLEIKEPEEQKIKEETQPKETKIVTDDFMWYPKQKVKSDTIYKASRNKMSAKVDLKVNKNNEIINNKKQTKTREIENPKVCPNCGTKQSSNAETCYICGTKL